MEILSWEKETEKNENSPTCAFVTSETASTTGEEGKTLRKEADRDKKGQSVSQGAHAEKAVKSLPKGRPLLDLSLKYPEFIGIL